MSSTASIKEGASFDETAVSIAKDFHWNEKLLASVKALGCLNLEEFRFYWSDEAKVSTWADTQNWGDATAHALQCARLKRVWHAVRKQADLREADKGTLNTNDLDELLDSDELNDRKKAFWLRYHVSYPLEIQPGDQLISRVTRELAKFMLVVANLWLVRNMLHQIMTTRKRKHVAGDLYTDAPEEVAQADSPQDIQLYLNRMLTYLLALAIAGVNKVHGAPASSQEILGANSTEYVVIPLDVVMAYYYRTLKVAGATPYQLRLAHIQRLDQDERAEWVQLFREGNLTLGQVIQRTMQKRDAHWVPLQSVSKKLDDPLTPPKASAQDSKPTKRSRLELGDGTKLCGAYNSSKGCKDKNCKLEHRCSTVLRNQQSCGAKTHNFTNCPVVRGG